MRAEDLKSILLGYRLDAEMRVIVSGQPVCAMTVSSALDNLSLLTKLDGGRNFLVAGKQPMILRERRADSTICIRTRQSLPQGVSEWLELECR